MVAEGLQQLRAVHRQGVEQRVGDERQRHGQPPAPPQVGLTRQAGGQPAQRGRCQREQCQAMALGPVAHHVEQRVAMVDESVQVGQGASGGSPQGCLPCGGAAPEGGQHHGTAQGGLADGVHVLLMK